MSEYIIDISHEPLSAWNPKGEIVRCRDCVHRVKDPDPIDPGWPMMCEDTGRDMLEPDGFCSWGERRSTNQDEVGSSRFE